MMFRIATYNVWNAKTNWPRRLSAIAEEIALLDADVVALQEAPVNASPRLPLAAYLRQHTPYPHLLHLPYPGPADKREWPEGLLFLSKHRMQQVRANWVGAESTENSWGVRVVLQVQGVLLSVTNVHLDWRHAESRERHIVRIVRDVIGSRPCDVEILCGDFNDDGDVPVLQFLAGEVALDDYRTCWRDLAAEWHAARGETAPVTMDFEHNPRWQGKTIRDHSKRFDRIYLRTTESASEPTVVATGLFGQEPRNSLSIVPSDHYGLFVDLEVPAGEEKNADGRTGEGV
jgi:endonuclease/exonuclease/phosphatase family metal-dependent hydrolase